MTSHFTHGEVAERSNAAVLKTVAPVRDARIARSPDAVECSLVKPSQAIDGRLNG
jgi:hypothetical protein